MSSGCRKPGAVRRCRAGSMPARQMLLGLARRRALLHLRRDVPDPARRSIWSSAPSRTRDGNFTLDNIRDLLRAVDPQRLLDQHQDQRRLGPGRRLIGFSSPTAVVLGGLPGWLRPTLMTFSGVASNFAGVPLAFAFIATLRPHRPRHVLLHQISSASTSTRPASTC